jgi:hypothetical protein
MKSNFQKLQKSDSNIVSKTLKITIAILALATTILSCSKSDDAPAAAPTAENPKVATVSTFAGRVQGDVEGVGTSASFKQPSAIAIDAAGNFFICELGNRRVKKITPAGVVTNFVGGTIGDTEGTGSAAQFRFLESCAMAPNGNLFLMDRANNRISKVTPGGVVSFYTKNTAFGDALGNLDEAKFSGMQGIAIDASSNIYVCEAGNNKIKKITAFGTVELLAGNTIAGDEDATGSAARFDSPNSIAVNAQGIVYVVDNSTKIKKITNTGVVTTVAGSTSGDVDATGLNAKFSQPKALTFDSNGNLLFYDNGKIKRMTPAGVVTTIAGTGTGFQDGIGSVAKFNEVSSMVVNADGSIILCDTDNHLIRKITFN